VKRATAREEFDPSALGSASTNIGVVPVTYSIKEINYK
jgi:hypothetical protein